MGRYKASKSAMLARVFAPALFVCSAVGPAGAHLLDHKDLSLDAALSIATGAMASCRAHGFTVSVAVVGREGQILVHLRGDGSPPHSIENSYRRAYTALTFRRSSGQVEERMRKDPGDQLIRLDHVMAAQGGLPVTVAGEALGAVAVSGAPGGDKDEACARAGLEKAAGLLK